MTSIAINSVIVFIICSFVLCDDSNVTKSLCEDPYIHSADRLSNNTYRVYRGDYYWELVGLPDKVAKVNGPFKIWLKDMAPVTEGTSITTVVGGLIDGYTYKFKDEKYWVWGKNDVIRPSNGVSVPKGGFTAVYNDGDLDKKGYPRLVGFNGIKVFYFNTNKEIFRPEADPKGTDFGAFGEKFPSDIKAAMAFKSNNPKVKYYVYLFKREEYCYRPITGVDGCPEWRKNSELFGCSTASAGKSDSNAKPDGEAIPSAGDDKPEPDAGVDTPQPTQSYGTSSQQNLILILFFVLTKIFV